MVGRRDGKYVIWPLYFDASLSRREGRRVPKKLAVEKPSIDDILRASRELGLNPIPEKDARHPSRYWEKMGRVLVDKKGSKTILIKKIAKLLNETKISTQA